MPIQFNAVIKKFDQKGEKTGWTYIDIPEKIAQQLIPGNKKAFRTKGFLDHIAFEGISLVPMGGGDFILALKSELRKKLGKGLGAVLSVQMELDQNPIIICPELITCLEDEPTALLYFNQLPPSHRKYYSNWIDGAKTESTKAKRIAQAVTACSRKMHYGEMIRSLKK